MKIAYRQKKNGIEILRCWNEGENIQIPAEIHGLPVTSIGDYAFSPGYNSKMSLTASPVGGRHQDEEMDKAYFYEESLLTREDQEPEFSGDVVESVEFPKSLEAIGKYAFYGCRNLHRLAFSDRLHRLGAGIFTGCRHRLRIEIDMFNGESTCLKEICGEVRYELDVILRYHLSGQEAHLIFPEHYEEAVENTPARILFTQHHGSGNHFRQCFFERKVQYADYDRVFSLAEAQEEMDVLARLIYGRLAYPYQLSGRSKEMYREFGRKNAAKLADCYLEKENLDGLCMMTEQGLWTQDTLSCAILKASKKQNAEALSYLMQAEHRLFPPEAKTFEL